MFSEVSWQTLTVAERQQLIAKLREERRNLSIQSKHRRSKTKRAKTKRPMKFRNKELEQLFNSMPEDMKKFIRS